MMPLLDWFKKKYGASSALRAHSHLLTVLRKVDHVRPRRIDSRNPNSALLAPAASEILHSLLETYQSQTCHHIQKSRELVHLWIHPPASRTPAVAREVALDWGLVGALIGLIEEIPVFRQNWALYLFRHPCDFAGRSLHHLLFFCYYLDFPWADQAGRRNCRGIGFLSSNRSHKVLHLCSEPSSCDRHRKLIEPSSW